MGWARQPVEQPPVRRLTGPSRAQSLPARAVPDRPLQRPVVGQGVLVVLVRVAQRPGVEGLAQQFNLAVADAVRTPVVC